MGTLIIFVYTELDVKPKLRPYWHLLHCQWWSSKSYLCQWSNESGHCLHVLGHVAHGLSQPTSHSGVLGIVVVRYLQQTDTHGAAHLNHCNTLKHGQRWSPRDKSQETQLATKSSNSSISLYCASFLLFLTQGNTVCGSRWIKCIKDSED